ncbi:hypothetical protein [Pseudoxanthomonas mexicana]
MDRLSQWILSLALGWLAILGPAYGTTVGPVERAYDSYMEVHEKTRGWPTADRESEMSNAFDARFSSYFEAPLTQLSDEEVALLFAAANVAHAYSVRETYLDKMLDAFEVLRTRDAVSQRIHGDLYGALVASRQFDRARKLAIEFPQWPVETLPAIHPQATQARTALKVVGSAGLEQIAVEVENGPRIVVISHPLCHFSQRAVAAIEQDAALSKIMANSLWLAPVDRKLYIDVLAQWNQAHPAHEIMIAYDRAHWPALASWSTPTFYFLRDGKLMSVVEGWPDEGNRKQLLSAAKGIGL